MLQSPGSRRPTKWKGYLSQGWRLKAPAGRTGWKQMCPALRGLINFEGSMFSLFFCFWECVCVCVCVFHGKQAFLAEVLASMSQIEWRVGIWVFAKILAQKPNYLVTRRVRITPHLQAIKRPEGVCFNTILRGLILTMFINRINHFLTGMILQVPSTPRLWPRARALTQWPCFTSCREERKL